MPDHFACWCQPRNCHTLNEEYVTELSEDEVKGRVLHSNISTRHAVKHFNKKVTITVLLKRWEPGNL